MCLGDAKIYSSELKRKHGFIVRYVTKDSICHLELKGQDLNSYEEFQNRMKGQTRFHCEIWDKRFNLTSRIENKT